MIKKILLSLGLFGLGIINFSSAFNGYNYSSSIGTLTNTAFTNIYGSYGYIPYVSNDLNFATEIGGQVYSGYLTISLSDGKLFLWWDTDGLYGFNSYMKPPSSLQGNTDGNFLNLQGYMSSVSLCTNFYNNNNSNWYNPSYTFKPTGTYNYCTSVSDVNYIDLLNELYEEGITYYSVGGAGNYFNSTNYGYTPILCVSTDQLFAENKSYCLFPDLNSSLGYSQAYLDPTDFHLGIDSPIGGGNSDLPNQQDKQNYICPTFGQLLKQQNFDTGLCYNTTLAIGEQGILTIQKQNIQEAFSDYEELTNYWSLYKNYCEDGKDEEKCTKGFSGDTIKFLIIGNAYNKIHPKQLWNNCNIALNYDLNQTTCAASGYTAEQPTLEELEDRIINGNYTTINDIYVPGSGNILNRLLEDGETREEKANRDILGNFTQLVGKITSIFNTRSGVEGVIPEYILWLIFVSLFLTVILKK